MSVNMMAASLRSASAAVMSPAPWRGARPGAARPSPGTSPVPGSCGRTRCRSFGAQLLEARHRPVEVLGLEHLRAGDATVRDSKDPEELALVGTAVGKRARTPVDRDRSVPLVRRPEPTAIHSRGGHEL